MDKTAGQERKERVRAANSIEIIAARYTHLIRAGRQFKGLCPLHEENTPSFVVYPEQGRWWCYGACQTGGDVFKLVMLKEDLDFKGAVEFLDNGSIVDAPRQVHATTPLRPYSPAKSLAQVTEEHYTYLTLTKDVYRAALASELRLLRYLDERRIDGEAVRRFQIGYADGESLQRYFQFRSWKWIPVLAQELGLVRKDERGNEREYFRQRLVIPDLDGERAVYLVGRSTRGEQKIKYIGLSGVPKPLFGFARLERGGDYQRVFVAEGPFDALTLMMWDLPAVCLLGSYLKKDLRRTLERFERVYVVTDFDAAGQTAARVIACELGARATIVPSDLSLQGKDVNEIAQRYRDATARFERLVARADARSQMSAAVQDALRRLHAHNAAHPEREDIAWALLWKVMDVIGAEIEHGHTVVLWSRAYANHVGGKTSPVGGHIIRTIGALRGPNLHYSARRKGRADAECDLLSAEYIEVLDETGC
ncbi:MAG: toprim domain-containing protein [Anaerolineae bacterium]|nr:toprim domain-containing protein [Anaerolineae bacterium]